MAEVLVLTSKGCVHCGQATKLLEKLKPEFPKMRIKEINIIEHPELVTKYGLMATPGIVIDGELEFVGVPKEGALRELLKRGD